MPLVAVEGDLVMFDEDGVGGDFEVCDEVGDGFDFGGNGARMALEGDGDHG